MVIVSVSVITIIICGVVASDRVNPPVSDLTSWRIAEYHPDDHIIDPGDNWERHTFIARNKVSSVEV